MFGGEKLLRHWSFCFLHFVWTSMLQSDAFFFSFPCLELLRVAHIPNTISEKTCELHWCALKQWRHGTNARLSIFNATPATQMPGTKTSFLV